MDAIIAQLMREISEIKDSIIYTDSNIERINGRIDALAKFDDRIINYDGSKITIIDGEE